MKRSYNFMFKKKFAILLLISIISGIIQLIGLSYTGIVITDHDIEFKYIYNWDVEGTDGWYEGYNEKFRAQGHYKVDFRGDTAFVVGEVEWRYREWLSSELKSDYHNYETYRFKYSLNNGRYKSKTDQDYNTSGMNVWFHIPNGIDASKKYDILDASFEVKGPETAWVGGLMPFNTIKLHSSGTYKRNDAYGRFDAEYKDDYYFTPEGFLVQELYSEIDEGYDDGHWGKFKLNSVVYITSSNYDRHFNYILFFLVYWSPIIFTYITLYIIYDHIRWRTKVFHKKCDKLTIIQRNLPINLNISIDSRYSGLIEVYLHRAKIQNNIIVSAHNKKEIKGIGFIQQKEKTGTFFGSHIKKMIKYAKVKNAFTELPKIGHYKEIEKYIIFQIENLQLKEFNYDAYQIKSATKLYIPSIMKMISYEDYGTKRIRNVKWIKKTFEQDIILIATASKKETWVRRIIFHLESHHYPSPERVNDQILLGVGFATPSKKVGWLYGLYVHPAFRNIGLGKDLVNARLSCLKDLGCDLAITEIAEWNSPTKMMYSHLNAQQIGELFLIGKKIPKVKVRRH